MILLIISAIFALLPVLALGQDVECVARTGNNATIIFPEAVTMDVEGHTITEGSYLTVHGEDGTCVGKLTWKEGAQAVTVWGQDVMSEHSLGLRSGEPMSFRLYHPSDPSSYHELSITLATHSELYQRSKSYVSNGMYMVEAVRSKALRVEGKALSPAAPNPFHDQTRVTLILERAQHVEIEVFDIRGARVAHLHHGWLESGANILYLHADGLSSGTYFIVAQGDHFQHMRQVALTR